MKKSILKTLSLGIAAGAIVMCGVSAQAQTAMDGGAMGGGTMNNGTMGTGTMNNGAMMDSSAMPSMMPMQVTGTVLRYYVDRSGFVTAMDVQTADGIRMVRFSPSMAQNLTATYPVGSTASVFVTSSMMGGMTRYDLAGMGTTMPTPTAMMMPMMVSDLDILKSEPYTMIGAKSMRVEGTLTGYISDPMRGEVLALVLDNNTIVRVPRENRLVQASMAPERVTPLMRGASVVAYGLPEAPRYGSLTPYTTRLIGTGIAVNGRALGPLGFGRVNTTSKGTLFGFNVMGSDNRTPEEMAAMNSGYMTYTTPGMMNNDAMGGGAMGGGTMGGGAMGGGTMGGGTTGGTMGGGTTGGTMGGGTTGGM